MPGAPWSGEPLSDLAPAMGGRTKSARAGRRSVVPVHHPSTLSAVAFPWTLHQGVTLVIVAKATADLLPSGRVSIREDTAPLDKDVFLERAISGRNLEQERSLRAASDFAVYKRFADVTAVGHAYAPGGYGQASQATFRFGATTHGFERRIAVFGQRRWERGLLGTAPSAPEPFRRIPLVYERAFGGPGFADNPVGVGVAGPVLPNLEDPARLISSPTERPAPVAFGPVSKHWGVEARTLPPHADFPEDFDWTQFQQAPAGQQVRVVRGDESFSFAAMHPEQPLITGQLPGQRAHCMMTSIHGQHRELPLVLDTVAFDLDRMQVSLSWRAQFSISHPRAPEVQAVQLCLTTTGGSAPPSFHAAHHSGSSR